MSTVNGVADKIGRLVDLDGPASTALDGVRLFRISQPVARVAGVYDPSLCIIAQGGKHAFLGTHSHSYPAGHYLTATMPAPVEAEVRDASPERPTLGVLVDLRSRTMTELLVQVRSITPEPPAPTDASAGLSVAAWDDRFTTALDRLIDVLDEPADIDVLGAGRLRELLYAVLLGPAGPSIRRHVSAPSSGLNGVLTFMRTHLDQPLAVDDLADRAGMSRAAFDRHFKTMTTMSPLRYMKQLRLNDAAMLIASGTDIGQAARRVGYHNASQFSREFKSQFGASPRVWAANNAGLTDPQAVA